jgi:hypothetical protein
MVLAQDPLAVGDSALQEPNGLIHPPNGLVGEARLLRQATKVQRGSIQRDSHCLRTKLQSVTLAFGSP